MGTLRALLDQLDGNNGIETNNLYAHLYSLLLNKYITTVWQRTADTEVIAPLLVKQYVLTKFGYVQMMAVTLYATIFWYNTMYVQHRTENDVHEFSVTCTGCTCTVLVHTDGRR